MSLNLTGNNLIPYPYVTTSKNINGITFTVNEDGSVLANGTATDIAQFSLVWGKYDILTKGEIYYISGAPTVDKSIYVVLDLYNSTGTSNTWVQNFPADTLIDTTAITKEWDNVAISIVVKSGVTANNLLVKPMLNKGTTALPYEPYKSINPENIKVNISNNLIVYPYRYSSLNYNGIHYTTNDNGEIIANGSIEDNTKYSQFSLNENSKIFNIQKDIYTMSCPMSINDTAHKAVFLLDFQLDDKWVFTHSVNNIDSLSKTIDLRDKEFNKIYGYVRILKDATGTFENFTFKPMLNKGTSALPYEKYIAPKDVEKVVVAKSPNLIPYPFSDTAVSGGITATYNDDGSVTLNGTATADAYFWNVNHKPYLKAGTYTLSGCPEGGSRNTYALLGLRYIPLDIGNGDTLIIEEDTEKQLGIFVKLGITVENLVFKPMLNKGTTALPYQKYDREVVWSKTTSDEETTV